jgi:hypothetical protein
LAKRAAAVVSDRKVAAVAAVAAEGLEADEGGWSAIRVAVAEVVVDWDTRR